MTGRVDGSWRALVPISVRTTEQSPPNRIEAWVDTGFTGALVLPQSVIGKLGLASAGESKAELGHGLLVEMKMYHCFIDWLGETKQVQIAATEAELPLLGVELLHEHLLSIDYLAREVTIE